MSTTEPVARAQRGRAPDGVFLGADASPSWVLFAATMIGLASVINFIYGIAAISNSAVFVGSAKFVVADLDTLGWVLVAVAVTQALTSFWVAAGVGFARWLGVAIAFVNAIVQMMI